MDTHTQKTWGEVLRKKKTLNTEKKIWILLWQINVCLFPIVVQERTGHIIISQKKGREKSFQNPEEGQKRTIWWALFFLMAGLATRSSWKWSSRLLLPTWNKTGLPTFTFRWFPYFLCVCEWVCVCVCVCVCSTLEIIIITFHVPHRMNSKRYKLFSRFKSIKDVT